MANPRQRRKAKSSTHKAVPHSKRAKRLLKKMPTIRGPKALQDAWDPSKTLRQNYMALGLQHHLNPITPGGSEVVLCRTTDTSSRALSCAIDGAQPSTAEGPTVTPAPPKGFGRIIRDSSGNVVRVELPGDEDVEDASRRAVDIDTCAVAAKSELRIWANDYTERRKGAEPVPTNSSIIQDLENLAARTTIRERHTSLGERLYLGRLVSKYGDDLTKMARDRRLNPGQRTANELRRAIAKAGGPGVLCEGTDTKETE